jgi:phosphatidylinositol alpha-1,6-mannosyltransferase
MRVAFVTQRATGFDGWGRYTAELVRAVRGAGVVPVLVTSPGDVEADLADVEHHAILPALFAERLQTPRSLLSAPRLARILATCDVVHSVVEPFLPLVALAHGRRQPLVQTAHGTWAVDPFRSAARRVFFVPALRRVDLLVCQSRYTRDEMATLVDLPRHEVIPAGVRPELFASSAHPLPDWTAGGRTILLSVGSIKRRKGLHVAIDALAIVRRSHPTAELVLAGSLDAQPDYVARLRQQARERGVADAAHFVGPVSLSALVAWYRRADVLLAPAINDRGRFEGLGLSYLEAAAAGTPAVGTLGCGAEDAVVDGETGLLVPQADAAATAAAVARLLGDGALRREMGQAAERHAARRSWRALADALVARYAELVDLQGARRAPGARA